MLYCTHGGFLWTHPCNLSLKQSPHKITQGHSESIAHYIRRVRNKNEELEVCNWRGTIHASKWKKERKKNQKQLPGHDKILKINSSPTQAQLAFITIWPQPSVSHHPLINGLVHCCTSSPDIPKQRSVIYRVIKDCFWQIPIDHCALGRLWNEEIRGDHSF